MNPDDIKLSNLSKSFEYTKFCKELDTIEDLDDLRDIAKCYFKLYLRQQEVVADLVTTKS